MVVNKVFLRLLLTKVFKRIGPENVAHETMGRGLAESVDLKSILVKTRAKRNHRIVRS
jgi:hypothetical protein